MYCHRELSDTQVALALLNGLGDEATSDSFGYYGAGYMNNFIDAELHKHASEMAPEAEMETDMTNDTDNDSMSIESVGEFMDSPSDNWIGPPNPKNADLGPAPFFQRPKMDGLEQKMESIPVHYQVHWRYRGAELSMMTPAEYYALVQVEPLKKYNADDPPENCHEKEQVVLDNSALDTDSVEEETKPSTGAGRKPNKTFRFDSHHPLYHSHCQKLRSKHKTLIFNGKPPKHPGPIMKTPEIKCEDFHHHKKRWQEKADAYAKYYLCSFRPMEHIYSGEHNIDDPNLFTWEALCSWVEAMEQSPRLIDRLRVAAMFNHMYGFRSKSDHQEVLKMYRMRKRTMWSQKEKEENREVYSGLQTPRQDLVKSSLDEFDDDWDGCSSHVFRTQDVRDVLKELQYGSSQKAALDFVFKPLLANAERGTKESGSPSDFPPVDHTILGVSDKDDIKETWRALKNAKPPNKKPQCEESDEESDVTSGHDSFKASTKKEDEAQSESVESVTQYLASREHTKCQEQVVHKLHKYFLQLGTKEQRLDPKPTPLQILMTGDPGTGKSYVIDTIKELAHMMGVGHVQTAAFNGIAAVNIDGSTLCSLLGIGKVPPAETDFAKVKSTLTASQLMSIREDLRSEELVLLIIDEVSTLDSVMIATIDSRLQNVMQNDKPFGGIAVLFCGDFNQLGAVRKAFLLEDLLAWAEYQEHHCEQCESPATFPHGSTKKSGIPQRASVEEMISLSMKATRTKNKKINTSLYSRYSVRGMVHHGCSLFSKLERHHLQEQCRAKDPLHMKLVKKLANGCSITWKDLSIYKTLDRKDAKKKEWQFAPILVSNNHERMEIVHQKALLFAKLHNTYVFKWKNRATNWKNKPQDTSSLYDENPMLWQYFVPGSEAFLSKNINTSLGLANGSPLVCHSLLLDKAANDNDQIIGKISGPNRLPFGSEIVLSEPPLAVNMKLAKGMDGREPSRVRKMQTEALKKHCLGKQSSHVTMVDGNVRGFAEDGDIVISISEKSDKTKTLKMRNGSPLLGHISQANITPILAFDLAFAMTVHKAQGRTIKRVILALDSRSLQQNQLKYASIFVGLSRVKKAEHIRLLEHGRGSPLGGRHRALGYISSLLPQKTINMFNAGFNKDLNGHWNRKESLKAKY